MHDFMLQPDSLFIPGCMTLTMFDNVVWEPEQESVGDQLGKEQSHRVLNNTL